MLFKQELAEKILLGDKTQTRRPVKAGEVLRFDDDINQMMVIQSNGRLKIATERDYAVQYGRGKPCRWWGYSAEGDNKLMVTWDDYQNWHQHEDFAENYSPMRIRITDIRREDVRTISHADAIAEGFSDSNGFLETWCKFYDKKGLSIVTDFGYSPAQVPIMLAGRPAEKYQAWAYTFELVV